MSLAAAAPPPAPYPHMLSPCAARRPAQNPVAPANPRPLPLFWVERDTAAVAARGVFLEGPASGFRPGCFGLVGLLHHRTRSGQPGCPDFRIDRMPLDP